MTEQQARKLCTDRGRNPDRDMTGPDGPMKAWQAYDNPDRHHGTEYTFLLVDGSAPCWGKANDLNDTFTIEWAEQQDPGSWDIKD